MSATREITLTVNGVSHRRHVEVRKHLGDFLRQDLGLTGTHLGCDGVPARSCLMLAVQADGAALVTVEGLAAADGALHPLQQAFRDEHGLQCGFCTPGMLMTLVAFLAETPRADEPAIRDAISGNICRCTGYESIVDAALKVSRAMAGDH